jgi:hypothetical protein
MPATSTAQRRLMAIAEHDPSAVYGKNQGVLSMTHQQLHDFAATKEKSLPHRVKPAKKKERSAFFGE